MANKMKAWREASRKNTVEGELIQRQMTAQRRQFNDTYPSPLLAGLLKRGGIAGGIYYARG